jgi:O-6-methylguanine DNA methyltransferase
LQQFVLAKLLEIPRAQVRSYAWVAKEIGNPRAVRAVASAIGKNPIPILIPCHRVVRSDGQIGEFIFGPMFKHRLLENEGVSVHDTAAMKQQCNPD